MASTTRDTLFKPTLSKAESKAETVSRVAMGMIEDEATKRDAKLARLREARLAQEAAAQKAVPVAAPRTRKPAKAR